MNMHHLDTLLEQYRAYIFLVGITLLIFGWIFSVIQQKQISRQQLEIKNLWLAVDPLGKLPTLPRIPLAHIEKSDISSKVVLDQKQEY